MGQENGTGQIPCLQPLGEAQASVTCPLQLNLSTLVLGYVEHHYHSSSLADGSFHFLRVTF